MLLQMALFHSSYGWVVFHCVYVCVYISRRILANYYQQVPWQQGYGEWKELRKLTSSPKALIYFQLLTCSFPARAGRREEGQGCPDHSRLRQEPSGFTRMLMPVRNLRRKEGRKAASLLSPASSPTWQKQVSKGMGSGVRAASLSSGSSSPFLASGRRKRIWVHNSCPFSSTTSPISRRKSPIIPDVPIWQAICSFLLFLQAKL